VERASPVTNFEQIVARVIWYLSFFWALEEEIMDKDRVVGSAKEIKGAIKQVVGKAVGDAKLESDGKSDKIEGKVQNAIGGLKDKLKGK
jgi:uncharacterized protein YjbJ (UPF0337 family)